MAKGNQMEGKEMNLVDHLSELRNRLIVTALLFIGLFIVGFIYIKDIYWFFVNDIDMELTAISPTEIIWIYFSMAGLVAIVGTIPLLTYQIWAFVKPGLLPHERKATLGYIPAVFLLFIGGLVFGYFIFVELIMPFLLSLNDGMFNIMFTVDRYFTFLFRVTIPFAVLFELPIIVMFLTSLGILTPAFMIKNRKYAYFGLIVIGVLITPPDFVLQIIVAVPLILLYEIGVQLSKVVYKRKLKKHKEFMEEEEPST
ncbi:twin-arginine translocase subunit TatC [Oceanobacillus alkalisoli]|uniref:twin-arginine translocase subunit TatC n=1 Tax=Oceanobacillus alkalisoli TaxID=2925113 RepID=UPI001EEFA555|nr:twin-arginine translocase subunit TatC [Oceanobacillus alkalisoli]MCF3941541.1 twin-arginine translocase subunit TatC [Oceanobacillus alkalisoli]MCG5102875.1 twin-arginine translocase subunit TatC [Oceanobacillus alkalisoli]